MRGVEISELDLGTDGAVTVKSMATVFEDGLVEGDSYLASSLRKEVEAHGPMDLRRALRLYNNGYTAASLIDKGRVYLKEGQEAPGGMRVEEGPRGGRYYETEGKRGRPLKEAPKDWIPKIGDRVRIRMLGANFNGKLARVVKVNAMTRYVQVTGVGWTGGAQFDLNDGQLVPTTRTAKEKREMKAKDILTQEFGKTHKIGVLGDEKTELHYDVFETEAGPQLWLKTEPHKDRPWAVSKESAVSLESFMKSLLEMNVEALQDMKDEVKVVIFSPIPNPTDRLTSKRIGAKFVSAASMNMNTRVMHIWEPSKDLGAERLANTLTHETGHAVDARRSTLYPQYLNKRRKFWDERKEQGLPMPADDFDVETVVSIEKEYGIPPNPEGWMDDYSKWKDLSLALGNPDLPRFWVELKGESSWNELTTDEKIVVGKNRAGAYPVSEYAKTNVLEYYAEAYTHYMNGKLSEKHTMREHFSGMEAIKQWVQQ